MSNRHQDTARMKWSALRGYCKILRPSRSAKGFTLIEVMVAGALLGVLVIGISGLWTQVGAHFLDLTLRQKAVFVLNGEMERLSAMYSMTDFRNAVLPSTDGYIQSPPLPAIRNIYPDDVAIFLYSQSADFVDANFDDFVNGEGHRIYFYMPGSPEQRRNFTWIDKDRKILGQVSWLAEDLEINTCGPVYNEPCFCFGFDGLSQNQNCVLLTLFLEFPFKLAGTAFEPANKNLQFMTLKTIVGRRRYSYD